MAISAIRRSQGERSGPLTTGGGETALAALGMDRQKLRGVACVLNLTVCDGRLP